MTALHPRVGVANGQTHGQKPRTVWGATLDGRYHGDPRCRTRAGAEAKARRLTRILECGERCRAMGFDVTEGGDTCASCGAEIMPLGARCLCGPGEGPRE